MEPFDKSTINRRVRESIYVLLDMHLDGCIAGSCVLSNDFSEWESEPDIDFFAYSETSWVYAVSTVLSKDRYKPGSPKDKWKLSRIAQGKHRTKNKWITQTIYLQDTETGLYINMSYKPGTSNVTDVLSRFDTIAIMVGICCRTETLVDLRQAFYPAYWEPVKLNEGHANPIRLWYMAEGWDEMTWSRELARIKKYDTRGFEMHGMAAELLDVAARVLERGETVGSEKSKARYLNLMLSCYRPVVWLEEFLGEERTYEGATSKNIFNEILGLIKELPKDVQGSILADLYEPLDPSGDKIFEPGEEEEEDDDETPDDR